MFILCVWVFVCRQRHGCGSGCVSPWIWSYDNCEPLHLCWKLNLGPSQEQLVFLTTKQPQNCFFFFQFPSLLVL